MAIHASVAVRERTSEPQPAPRRYVRVAIATVVLLVATALLATPWGRESAIWQPLALLVAAYAVVIFLFGGLRPSRTGTGRTRYLSQLLMQLAPVILLSIAFPLATTRLAAAEIGGAPLSTLLLASSLTVPWLSQIVCMPMFEGVWDYTAVNDFRGLARRLLAAWPISALLAVPSAALFAVPVAVSTGWPARTMLSYLVLVLLHLVFAQSLVYSITAKKAGAWAAGWSAYALVFVLSPGQWYLPALAGIATQLGYLLFVARAWPRPIWVTGAVRSLGQGALLGSLLWADKFLYFLRWHDNFDAGLVFAAMLPAIIAYNFYFVVEAPRIDLLVNGLRGAMEDQPLRTLNDRSNALRTHIESSAVRAAFIAAFLGFGWMVMLGLRHPGSAALLGAIILASWCFVLGSLLCYNLAYLGRSIGSHVYGGVHIALATAAFLLAPSPTVAYTALGLVEVFFLAYLFRACLAEWRTPEYSLFWKHATRW